MLDVMSAAEVVTYLKARGGSTCHFDRPAPRTGSGPVLLQLRPGGLPPQAIGRIVHLGHQRAAHGHHIVITRLGAGLAGKVRHDIDAAGISHFMIDHHQLAMHAAQALAIEGNRFDFRPEEQHAHTRMQQILLPLRRKMPHAKAIQQQIDFNPAPRRCHQCGNHRQADFIAGKQITFEKKFRDGHALWRAARPGNTSHRS